MIALLYFILSASITYAIEQPLIFSECGDYELSGHYEEIESSEHNHKKKNVFILNKGTNSEVKIFLGEKLPSAIYKGTKLTVKLTLISKCLYLCEALYLDFVKSIDPFDNNPIYKGTIEKSKETKSQACVENSFLKK